MAWVIRVLANEYTAQRTTRPTYLASGDVEAHGGRGEATWADDPKHALHFASAMAALDFWKQQSKTRPLREDGRPNRPLTAFTVSIEPFVEMGARWAPVTGRRTDERLSEG